jgi:hypothetical protein
MTLRDDAVALPGCVSTVSERASSSALFRGSAIHRIYQVNNVPRVASDDVRDAINNGVPSLKKPPPSRGSVTFTQWHLLKRTTVVALLAVTVLCAE